MAFYLAAMKQKVINTLEVVAGKNGLWLCCEKVSCLPERVRADADKLRRILFNLPDIAIACADEGGAALHLNQLGHGGQGYQGLDAADNLPFSGPVCLKAQDMGPDIDQEIEIPDATAPLQPRRPEPNRLAGAPLAGMAVLFFVSAFLFVWPFLAAPSMRYPHDLFVYLFSAWAFVIALIYLLIRCHQSVAHREEDQRPDA